MDFLFDFNWISLFALGIFILVFILLKFLTKKIPWVYVVLISLVLGVGLGFLFKSENNTYLTWVNMIGNIYVNIIKLLVGPIILISVFTSFIQLKNKKNIKTIGIKSVVWLLLSAALAVILSITLGLVTHIGRGAGEIFSDVSSVSESTVSAYQGLSKSLDEVITNLFPSNIVSDFLNNNVVAIIIIAIALALGYIAVLGGKDSKKVTVIKDISLALKKILFKVLEFVVSLTPYAVLCLVSVSASKIFTNIDSMLQLLLLVGLIYLTSIIHTYGLNGLLVKFVAKLNPIKFFKKTFGVQATAFTTQSSVGTLPVTTATLTKQVGIKEEVTNFTAPLGTTIGMPGCTCIWPILLVIFYINATGVAWGVGDYIILGVLALLLSLGSAGVPGIAIVSAVGLFQALNLPVAIVILFIPINSISDMIRTLDNVSTATVASAIVARRTNNINDNIFNDLEEYVEPFEDTDSIDSLEGLPEIEKPKACGGSNFLEDDFKEEPEEAGACCKPSDFLDKDEDEEIVSGACCKPSDFLDKDEEDEEVIRLVEEDV